MIICRVLSLILYFSDCPLRTLETVVMETPVLCEMVDNVSFMWWWEVKF